MRSGLLRHRLTIQKLEQMYDRFGAPKNEEWVDYVKVWGSLEAMRGNEYWETGERQSRAVYRFKVRYRDDLTTLMRIIYKGQVFNITALLPDNTLTELTIMCLLRSTEQEPEEEE